MNCLALPPVLQPGDSIGLVAPAGPVDPGAFERAIAALERRGFRTRTYRDVTTRDGYLAGVDDERVAELNAAFRDADTSAVLPIRGGYGLIRILDRLDYDTLAAHPKLIAGFSDITALHAAVHRYADVATLHSPNLQDGLGNREPWAAAIERSYWWALAGDRQTTADDEPLPSPQPTIIRRGEVEAPLVGGNLAVLTSLIGTPFEPDTAGAILLLEDVNETPYRIDRMLAQLRLAGKFSDLAGVAIGQFTPPPDDDARPAEYHRLFTEYFGTLNVPAVANLPVGHTAHNLTLPLGARVSLDANIGRLNPAAAYAERTRKE